MKLVVQRPGEEPEILRVPSATAPGAAARAVGISRPGRRCAADRHPDHAVVRRRRGRRGGDGSAAGQRRGSDMTDLDDFRRQVREWCDEHIPRDWRECPDRGRRDEEFVRFQKDWFAELHSAGFAVPHWPSRVGRRDVGGRAGRAVSGTGRPRRAAAGARVRRDPPRRVDTAGRGHRRAAPSRTCPRSSTARSGCRASPNRRQAPTWRACAPPARRDGDTFVVNGQKLWASGGMHADWCLLLARTDPDAPKRKGISYFLMDMTTPGVDVRPIRNAIGDSHFCEIFLNDVRFPPPTSSARRTRDGRSRRRPGRRARHDDAGARRAARQRGLPVAGAGMPASTIPIVADRLAQFEIEITGLRGLCREVVRRIESGTAGPADASIVKLFYSELLQRMTDFGAEVGGLAAHTELAKPMSSGWESGSLDARLHRLVGVDDPRRGQRDPAHHHR